jgi:hypothetical protein
MVQISTSGPLCCVLLLRRVKDGGVVCDAKASDHDAQFRVYLAGSGKHHRSSTQSTPTNGLTYVSWLGSAWNRLKGPFRTFPSLSGMSTDLVAVTSEGVDVHLLHVKSGMCVCLSRV